MNDPTHGTAATPHGGPHGRGRGRAFPIFLGVCLAVLAIDFVHHRHTELPIEAVPGFYGFYGFVACVALVLAARALRRVLMRAEDYYDGR